MSFFHKQWRGITCVMFGGVAAGLSGAADSSIDIPDRARTEQIVSACSGVWNSWNPQDSFSNDLPRTALLGNGDVGIVSGGSGMEKTYLISKSDFWSCGNLKGKFSADKRYKTQPLPIGGVTIRPVAESSALAETKSFHEKLDIWKACLETELTGMSGESVSMKAWMAATENVLIVELKSPEAMDLEIDVWCKADQECFPADVGTDENAGAVSRWTFNGAPENPASWRSQAVLAPSVVHAGLPDHWKNKSEATVSRIVRLQPGQSSWLVVAIGGGGQTYGHDGRLKGWDPWVKARELLGLVRNEAGVASLLKSHADWWREYWAVSSIDLSPSDEETALAERYYYGAQYLMGSGIRNGKLAPGLFGVWHTTDTPNWSSDYHLNYNFIASFYGTASSNRCDLLMPAAEAMLAMEREGMECAANHIELQRINREYVNSRSALRKGIADAILYPVGIGPWGTVTDDSYHRELLNVSYSSWPIIQYYNYTLDRDFLARTYGFLKKCARLYEVWLERDEDGRCLLVAGYNEGSWAHNPAVELATVKMLLAFLIKASEELDMDAGKRSFWKDLLTRLPEQPVSEWKGKPVFSLAEREWKKNTWKQLDNPIPWDGNILPLDVILPAGELGYYSPAEQQQVGRNTIDAFGDGAWGQINNFPRIFYDAVQLRYPAEKILKHMAGVLKKQMGNNLAVRDGYHGLEKVGATAAINSMLVLKHKGVIKVFPNWPKDRNAAFSRLRVPGGFLVSAAYDGCRKTVVKLEITSLLGGRLTMACPWEYGTVVALDSSGKKLPIIESSEPEWNERTLSLPETRAGETYRFSSLP